MGWCSQGHRNGAERSLYMKAYLHNTSHICFLSFYRLLEESRASQRRPKKLEWVWETGQREVADSQCDWRRPGRPEASEASVAAPAALTPMLLGEELGPSLEPYLRSAEMRTVAGAHRTLLNLVLCLVVNGIEGKVNTLIENEQIKSQHFHPLKYY